MRRIVRRPVPHRSVEEDVTLTMTVMEEVSVSVVAVVVVHQTGRPPRGLLLDSVAVDDAGNDTVAVFVVVVAALRIGSVMVSARMTQ